MGLNIRDGSKYFRKSLMPSTFKGNRIEGQIKFLTSTLGLLVNKLITGMPIRVSGIPAELKYQ